MSEILNAARRWLGGGGPKWFTAGIVLACLASIAAAGFFTGRIDVKAEATVAAAQAAQAALTAERAEASRREILALAEIPGVMNPHAAYAAQRAGTPYAAAGGDGRICPVWLRLPDGATWVGPPLADITITGTRMTPGNDRSQAGRCDESGPEPDSGAADPAAVAAAGNDGVPYIATRSNWADGCHAWITLPGGRELGVDSRGLADGGEALEGGEVRAFGCEHKRP